MENSEHIDAERAKRNIYWDCYRGITTFDNRNADEKIRTSKEKRFYRTGFFQSAEIVLGLKKVIYNCTGKCTVFVKNGR